MREYQRNNKPIIHSTQIWEYYNLCPAAFKFSEKPSLPNEAMKRGLILEGELWGWKDIKEREKLLKGKRSKTLEEIQKEVEIVKDYFPKGGKPFAKIEYETDEYILAGECDYLTRASIFDLKRTASFKYWESKESVIDFLQGYYYPYIIYKNTGHILPFTYIVYAADVKLVKKYVIKNPGDKFDELEEIISKVVNDLFYSPEPSEKCLNGVYGKCNYLYYCKEGKEFVTQTKYIGI